MTAHRIPKVTDDPYVPLTMAQWLEQPVWQETWEENEGIVSAKQNDWSESIHRSRFGWEQGTNFGAFGPIGGRGLEADDRDVARATLAAAAPEMARTLLAVEWGASNCVGRCCPDCGGDELKEYEPRTGHRDGCALDAALRSAGVR